MEQMEPRGQATGQASACSCAEARAHLEAFLDHECDEGLVERLTEHVRTCPQCSRVADAERHLREILRSRCAEQAPASLRERVLSQLGAMRVLAATPGLESIEHYEEVSTPAGSVRRYSQVVRYRS